MIVPQTYQKHYAGSYFQMQQDWLCECDARQKSRVLVGLKLPFQQ